MTADDRVRRVLQRDARDIEHQVDTEAALARVLHRRRPTRAAVLVGLVAVAAAAAAVAVVMTRDHDGGVVAGDTTAPSAPASPSVSSSTTVAPTTAPTAPAPTPTTSAPTTAPTTPASTGAAGTVDFDGIGALRVGMTLDELPGWTSAFDLSPSCGMVTPTEGAWEHLRGLVVDDKGVLRVAAAYTSDPAYRTAAGVGAGSTIDEVRAAYGDRLVEAAPAAGPDGSVDQVGGAAGRPAAWYGPVAAVYEGDKAITFIVDTQDLERIRVVKVSGAEFSGDDEGCA